MAFKQERVTVVQFSLRGELIPGGTASLFLGKIVGLAAMALCVLGL